MQIKLIRHGESEHNARVVNRLDVGDHNIDLTPKGEQQALETGRILGAKFVKKAIWYRSPYLRARRTHHFIILGAGLDPKFIKVYEDPRLREVDHGYDNITEQEAMRAKHGWFYYRFRGGESPADCHDRCAHFLETMMRQIERKRTRLMLFKLPPRPTGIVMHGLTARCFVTRFMHLSVEQFDNLDNPHNCDIITIAHKRQLANPQIVTGKWGVEGLRFRS